MAPKTTRGRSPAYRSGGRSYTTPPADDGEPEMDRERVLAEEEALLDNLPIDPNTKATGLRKLGGEYGEDR